MKKYFIGGLLPFLILFGLSYGLIKAADVEVILGTSSGFTIVRGTSVSAGTSTFFVGSSTVSIGTTTQSAMLTVAGSATVTGTLTAGSGNFVVDNSINRAVIDFNTVGIGTNTPSSSYMLQITDSSDLGVVVGSSGSITAKTITATGSATLTGPVLIGTNTPRLASALYVGSSTTGALGTITAGFLSVGTITADLGLHGTTTVHFPAGINVTGPKNFLIPHPDPQKRDMGWVLRHSCIESPTRGDTLYRYKVEIESDGEEAFIDLPSYWLYLNENSEVWVSPVGQFAQGYGYVDEVLNKLVLKGEKKGFYNVLLIGTRKDQYAKAFDAKGVEYIDPAINELLTRGEKKGAGEIQLIDAHNDHVIKNFMDPIVDRFGLATHQ